jgi:F0F1-type ATP synthase membrane subunit a
LIHFANDMKFLIFARSLLVICLLVLARGKREARGALEQVPYSLEIFVEIVQGSVIDNVHQHFIDDAAHAEHVGGLIV